MTTGLFFFFLFFKITFPPLFPGFIPDLLWTRAPPSGPSPTLTLCTWRSASRPNGRTDGGDISDPSGSEIQRAA